MKGNTQHLSFLAFHGQAAKQEIQCTIFTRQKREDNKILLLGQEYEYQGGPRGAGRYRKIASDQGEGGRNMV